MANKVYLNSVIHNNPVTGRTLYGVNMFDESGDAYELNWEVAEVLSLRGLDILKKVIMVDSGDMAEIIGYMLQEQQGLTINDEYFDYEIVFKVCEETAAIRDGEELEGQDPWYEDPDWSLDDWRVEVGVDNTRLGYLAWVKHKRDGAEPPANE